MCKKGTCITLIQITVSHFSNDRIGFSKEKRLKTETFFVLVVVAPSFLDLLIAISGSQQVGPGHFLLSRQNLWYSTKWVTKLS
jgi:hypothetical protein